MSINFKDWKMKTKMLFICLLLSIVPIVILGISSYGQAESAVYKQIEDKLSMQAKYYKDLLVENLDNADKDIAAAKENAKSIVKQQALLLIQLIRVAGFRDLERLKDIIASFTVGKTGYIYVLSYDGRYIVSKNRLRDGEDINNSIDATGRLYIQDIVKKARAMGGDTVDFDIYKWKNVGETVEREKIAAIVHVPALRWVIGVSAYFDDLVDINLTEKSIERFKAKLKAEKVGSRGYMYVMNSKGDLIMHPDKEGQNIYQYDYIKKICQMKNGTSQYNWEGSDKVVGFVYYEPLDWIIASGSYLVDFTSQLSTIQLIIAVTIVVSIVVVIIISFLFSNWLYRALGKSIEKLSGSSIQISSASNQLANSSQEIANGATEQASSIEETTSSMEELASMVKQNLGNAKEASGLAGKTTDYSKDGYTQMEEMLASMKGINESSDQIKKVIKIIDNIAFQTNILALNAAVEAARAGEAGMGFAVVADEVKTLANKSADAAKETSDMIEDSIRKIEAGANIATKLAGVFKEILLNVEKVAEMSKEVESASTQQDAGINQVNKAIIQFDEIVQSNASSAEETASSAVELSSQSEMLKQIVGELISLVNGNGRSNGSEKLMLEKVTPRTLPGVKTTAGRQKTDQVKAKTTRKKEISPEKLIPFDEDEEFKDIK